MRLEEIGRKEERMGMDGGREEVFLWEMCGVSTDIEYFVLFSIELIISYLSPPYTWLIQVHASTAGLKGLVTKLVADGIEDVRKCCGGHGYVLDSGIAALSADYAWQPTAEGELGERGR